LKKKKVDVWFIIAAAIFFVLYRYMGVNIFLCMLIIAIISVIIEIVKKLKKKEVRECTRL